MRAWVASLYQVLIAHRSPTPLWATGGVAWLTVTATGCLACGIVAYRLGKGTAKRRETLSRYCTTTHRRSAEPRHGFGNSYSSA